MTRILVASLLLTSAFSAVQASILFPRQESTSTSLDQVYSSIESFSTEVTSKISSGQCTESDSCGGWLQSALDCVGDGTGNPEDLAKCACQGDFVKTFQSCVTCVGTDSATKAGEALNGACSSTESSATESVSSSASAESASNSGAPSSSSSSPSSSSSSSSPVSTGTPSSSSSTTASGAAATTSPDSGSGATGLNFGIENQLTMVLGMVGTGLMALVAF
ncbi:hypothetical protein JCM5350_002825 [Sporobolomyces pararoseus]